MSEFFDREAEQSEGEESGAAGSEDEAAPPKKKAKKVVHSDDDDDDDDEDDEDAIQKEMKGFVVEGDDDEEEGGGGDDKSDKSNDSDDDDIDQDDLDLVRDNLGIEIKKKSRVRLEDDSDDEGGAEEGEEATRRRIEQELFTGDDEGDGGETPLRPAPEAVASSDRGREDSSGSESDEDEAGNWIVDERGQPVQPVRRRKGPGLSNVNSAQLEEARDIFGANFDWDDFVRASDEEDDESEEEEEEVEEDEFGERRVKRRKDKKRKATVWDTVEPIEIEEGFMGDEDKRIQLADCPERFQLRRVPVTECEEAELEAEARWIYYNAFEPTEITNQQHSRIYFLVNKEDPENQGQRKPDTFTRNEIFKHIGQALKFMRNELFEVPFIAFYRKEHIKTPKKSDDEVDIELEMPDLWKIYQWDEKWCQLLSRRRHLGELFERMQSWQQEVIIGEGGEEVEVPDDVRLITDDDFNLVREADTMEELADVNHYFDLYHGAHIPKLLEWEHTKKLEENAEAEEPQKKPIRRDAYHDCLSSGLSGFAAKFGLKPAHLAKNMKEDYILHEVDSYMFPPDETAMDYVCELFQDPERVVLGGKYMVAKELSREPALRSVIRKRFNQRAMISTTVTKKGRKEIDENHPIFTMKYLKNKPVQQLVGDEFLKLVQAEENDLISICIHADYAAKADGTKEMPDLAEEFVARGYYRRDAYSDVATAWNNLRDETLEMCIKDLLMPMLRKELRTKLVAEAKEAVLAEACRKMYNWIMYARYEAVLEGDVDDEELIEAMKGAKVLAIAYSPVRDEAAFGAMLDGDGELVDHIKLEHFTKRLKGGFIDNRNKKVDLDCHK